MSGYFERLIARAAGQAPVLRPKLPALFEPLPGNAETDAPDATIDSEPAPRARFSAAPEAAAPVVAVHAADVTGPITPPALAASTAQTTMTPPVAGPRSDPAPTAQPAPTPIQQTTHVTHETRVRFSEPTPPTPPAQMTVQPDRKDSHLSPAATPDDVHAARVEPQPAKVLPSTRRLSVPHERLGAPDPAKAAPRPSAPRVSRAATLAAPPIVTQRPRPAPLVPNAPPRQAVRSSRTMPEAPPVVIRIGRIDVHTAPAEAPGPRPALAARPSPPQHAGPSLADFLAGTSKR